MCSMKLTQSRDVLVTCTKHKVVLYDLKSMNDAQKTRECDFSKFKQQIVDFEFSSKAAKVFVLLKKGVFVVASLRHPGRMAFFDMQKEFGNF